MSGLNGERDRYYAGLPGAHDDIGLGVRQKIGGPEL